MPAKLHNNHNYPPASLLKQLAAMLYDSLLIFSILFVAIGITVTLNQGVAINSVVVYVFLVSTIFVFYGWFWGKSGQTLGMRVWKIQIVSESGGHPNWCVSFLRLIFAFLSFACLGMGYWWRLFNPCTWHDKLSRTRVIDTSTKASDKNAKNSASG